MDYFVYADGACSGNPGPGGWAWIMWEDRVEDGYQTHEGSGSVPETTNNQMELRAAAEAMEFLIDGIIEGTVMAGASITLRFDSEYVLKGLTEWLPGWKARNWKGANKKPVKNRELWERLDAAHQDLIWRCTLALEWVKGHSEDVGNDLVDELAVQARDANARVEPDEEGDIQFGDALTAALADDTTALHLLREVLHPYAQGEASLKDTLTALRTIKHIF